MAKPNKMAPCPVNKSQLNSGKFTKKSTEQNIIHKKAAELYIKMNKILSE